MKLLRALTSSMLLSLEIANAWALLFTRLIATLRFLPKSFYFFFNRIARYDGSKESRNLSSSIDEVSIPQITCKAIFRSCLECLDFFYSVLDFYNLLRLYKMFIIEKRLLEKTLSLFRSRKLLKIRFSLV